MMFFGIPVIIYLVLIFTDPIHHLMRKSIIITSFGNLSRLSIESTPLSLLFIGYGRVLGLAVVWKLVVNLKNVSVFNQRQYYAIILAVVVPYLITLAQSFFNIGMNTAIASIFSGLFIFYSIVHHKLLMVSPIAKDKIMENLKEGIIVIDHNDIIIDINPSAFVILQSFTNDTDIIGQGIPVIFGDHQKLVEFYTRKQQGEIEIEIEQLESYYAVNLVPILLKKEVTSYLLIFSDITDRKRNEMYLYSKATTDYLTKVFNRQYIFETAVKQIQQIDHLGGYFSLLVIDIDKFKYINDTYGHNFGDMVLEEVGQALQQMVAGAGIVGRTGGEEFAVLLPSCQEVDAYKLAEKMRRHVAGIKIPFDENKIIEITISIGIKSISSSIISFEELYHQADQALYLSKTKGRNQTTIA